MSGERDLELVAYSTDGLSPAELRHAAVVTCGYANDVAEAEEFLLMLGLVEHEP